MVSLCLDYEAFIPVPQVKPKCGRCTPFGKLANQLDTKATAPKGAFG